MYVFLARIVLPVVTSVAATLFLATAVPHDLATEASAQVAPVALARAEVGRCVAQGRDADACLDETDGKALIVRADWLASDEGAFGRERE